MNVDATQSYVKRFIFGLISKTTFGNYPENEYAVDRSAILANSKLKTDAIDDR